MVTLSPPKNRSYAYCSDTIYDPSIIEFITGVDLLYHESTFLEDKAERATQTFHSTAKQAATIAKMAHAKKLLLGHYSARYGNLQAFKEDALDVFENSHLSLEGDIIHVEHS